MSMLGSGEFEIAISVPLLFEYEDVLSRSVDPSFFLKEDVDDFLDYVCAIAHRQDIFFLWRPQLVDPQDDLVLEVAVAAGCDAIVTHNRRHFGGAEKFGVRIYRPGEFLALMEKPR